MRAINWQRHVAAAAAPCCCRLVAITFRGRAALSGFRRVVLQPSCTCIHTRSSPRRDCRRRWRLVFIGSHSCDRHAPTHQRPLRHCAGLGCVTGTWAYCGAPRRLCRYNVIALMLPLPYRAATFSPYFLWSPPFFRSLAQADTALALPRRLCRYNATSATGRFCRPVQDRGGRSDRSTPLRPWSKRRNRPLSTRGLWEVAL